MKGTARYAATVAGVLAAVVCAHASSQIYGGRIKSISGSSLSIYVEWLHYESSYDYPGFVRNSQQKDTHYAWNGLFLKREAIWTMVKAGMRVSQFSNQHMWQFKEVYRRAPWPVVGKVKSFDAAKRALTISVYASAGVRTGAKVVWTDTTLVLPSDTRFVLDGGRVDAAGMFSPGR